MGEYKWLQILTQVGGGLAAYYALRLHVSASAFSGNAAGNGSCLYTTTANIFDALYAPEWIDPLYTVPDILDNYQTMDYAVSGCIFLSNTADGFGGAIQVQFVHSAAFLWLCLSPPSVFRSLSPSLPSSFPLPPSLPPTLPTTYLPTSLPPSLLLYLQLSQLCPSKSLVITLPVTCT